MEKVPKVKNLVHIAAHGRNTQLVARLLAAKPDMVDAVNHRDWTALNSAIEDDDADTTLQLLNHNPKLINSTFGGNNVLQLAALSRHENLVRVILNFKPELARRRDSKGNTFLHYVCGLDGYYHKLEFSEELVKEVYEIDPSAINVRSREYSQTPVTVASMCENVEAERFLRWKMTFDENKKESLKPEEDFRWCVEQQCEELETQVLNEDLVEIVFDYLGFKRYLRLSATSSSSSFRKRRASSDDDDDEEDVDDFSDDEDGVDDF